MSGIWLINPGWLAGWKQQKSDQYEVRGALIPSDVHVTRRLRVPATGRVHERGAVGVIALVDCRVARFDRDQDCTRVRMPARVTARDKRNLQDVDVRQSPA